MSNIIIGVVENEMVIADTICLTLKKLGYNVLPPAPNYNRAIKLIEESKPDLLLLDINLGGLKDGIDVAIFSRSINNIPIIFLTANSDLQTIERAKIVKPNAYLVKPFTKEDLYAAIEIAISNYQSSNLNTTPQYLLVKTGYDFVKVNVNEIMYLESEHNYLKFHLFNAKEILSRITMQQICDKLNNSNFERINRSSTINTKFIQKLETNKVWLSDEINFSINKTTHEKLIEIIAKDKQ